MDYEVKFLLRSPLLSIVISFSSRDFFIRVARIRVPLAAFVGQHYIHDVLSLAQKLMEIAYSAVQQYWGNLM